MSCKSQLWTMSETVPVQDELALHETRYLMSRIREIPKKGYAFGHQDATAYGIHWQFDGTEVNSDVKQITGDLPGVIGFELGHLELGRSHNLDSVPFAHMKELIKRAHAQGMIVTVSWHPDNPGNGESAWDVSPVVYRLLEGGDLYPEFRLWMKRLSEFFLSLRDEQGRFIPVVFRPYHEMNGNWFWWGRTSCTPEEFKLLWKQTLTSLQREFQVHNLLYCYSSDAVRSKKEYLRYFPGVFDVDILGMDLYHKGSVEEYRELLDHNLSILADLGTEFDKPIAMTEGGLEKIPVEFWWTEVLHPQIERKPVSWALVWRNGSLDHHYAPFPGHCSEDDFRSYFTRPNVLFSKEVSRIK